MPIPTLAHFIWDHHPLSFLNFCSVASFVRHHPGWTVRVWRLPGTPAAAAGGSSSGDRPWSSPEHAESYAADADYFPLLTDPDVFPAGAVQVADPAPLLAQHPLAESLQSGVHRSDLLRLLLLHAFGGVYSDFDVLYHGRIEPFLDPDARFGIPYCNRHPPAPYVPVGFLYAQPRSEVLAYLLQLAPRRFAPTDYQCLGTRLLINPRMASLMIAPTAPHAVHAAALTCEFGEPVHLMDGDTYLKYDYLAAKAAFFAPPPPPAEAVLTWDPATTFGIHWFNGLAEAKRYQTALERGTAPPTPLDPFMAPYRDIYLGKGQTRGQSKDPNACTPLTDVNAESRSNVGS
jgi:hypothetical protein